MIEEATPARRQQWLAYRHANLDHQRAYSRERMRAKRALDPDGVCRSEKPNAKGKWFVDHCHSTGKVRGILCSFCNSMLGYAKDNQATLANAIEYLRKVS